MPGDLIFWLTAAFLCITLLYLLLDLRLIAGLSRFSASGRSEEGAPMPPSITVLVAARDEEANLPATLDALLAQDYPVGKMQIVVANDRSRDGTAAVLREYAARHPDRLAWIDVTEVPPGISPKKNALRTGLGSARGEWIAVTDADCVMGPGWLNGLSRHFSPETGMVLGLTTYAEPRRGFTSAEGVRALEFASYGIVSAALVGLGFPVIANANNLAYRRQAFEEAGGFERHAGIVSGDDDFTLQEIHATGRWKTRFSVGAETLVRTQAPLTWEQFWEQRKRWASKCLAYRPAQVLFLAMIFAFYVSIPLLLLAGFWSATAGLLGLLALAVKTGADFLVMRKGLSLFGLSPLLRHFPGTALLQIPLILAAVLAGTSGSFTWKGQQMSRKAR